MEWIESHFVKNAKLYAIVLESMWQVGEDYAKLLSTLLKEKGFKKSSTVLDVPCGIGRISIPLARLGYSVSGVDISPYFVNLAKKKARRFGVAKRTSFLAGDMKNVSSLLPSNHFDVALNIFTSIGYGTEEDDLTFFKNLRQIVRKDGLFIIGDLANRDYFFSHFVRNLYEETDRLLILHNNELDVLHSKEKSTWKYYLKNKGTSLEYASENSIDLRLYSPHEIAAMLENSGWKVLDTYDSLTYRRPFSPNAGHFTTIAEAI